MLEVVLPVSARKLPAEISKTLVNVPVKLVSPVPSSKVYKTVGWTGSVPRSYIVTLGTSRFVVRMSLLLCTAIPLSYASSERPSSLGVG